MRLISLIVFIQLAAACDGGGPNLSSTGLEAGATDGTITGAFFVKSIEPSVATAGSTLTLSGDGFSSAIKVFLNDTPVEPNVHDIRTMDITIPETAIGMSRLRIEKSGAVSTMPLLIVPGTPMMMAAAADQVCAGDAFMGLTGSISTGTKDCSGMTLTPAPKACVADGQVGCTTTAAFAAAETQNLAGKIAKGFTVAGVTGGYEQDLPDPANVRVTDTVGGVPGTLVDCATDGGQGCVANATFPAVDTVTKLLPENLKNGVTIASVTGLYPSAAFPLDGATAATSDLTSTNFVTHVKSSVPFEWFDSTGVAHTAVGDTDLIPEAIKNAVQIFDVTGNVTDDPNANCTFDGETDCLATTNFPAVDKLTVLLPQNIRRTVTIAGVPGGYPSSAHKLNGHAGAVVDLTAANLHTSLGSAASFEWFDSEGNPYTGVGDADLVSGNVRTGVNFFGVTGNVVESPDTCDTDGEVSCVANTNFPVVDKTKLVAGNIRKNVVLGTVTGNVVPSPANCNDDGGINCVAIATFPAVDATKLTASNIRKNVVIGQVTGEYPSFAYPLVGASGINDLDGPTFNAKLRSTSTFEWFDSQGARYTATGDTDLAATNVKSGTTIFDVNGGYAAGGPPNCTVDGQDNCVVNGSAFKAASMSMAVPQNIKTSAQIAGVTGTYAGGKSVVVTNPAGSDDAVAAGATFAINFMTTPEAGDSNLLVDLYMRQNSNADCGPGLAGAGWTLIQNDVIGNTYNWTTTIFMSGSYFICAHLHSDLPGDVYGVSPSPLFIGSPPGACGILADPGNWSSTEGGCKELATGLVWSQTSASKLNWYDARDHCLGLSQGGYADWRLASRSELSGAYNRGNNLTQAVDASNSQDIWTNQLLSSPNAYFAEWEPTAPVTSANRMNTYYALCVRP